MSVLTLYAKRAIFFLVIHKKQKDTATMSEKLDDYNPGIDKVWKSFAKKQGLEVSSAEKEKKFPEQKIVQYNDGSTAIVFEGEGTELNWADHKWVDDPSLNSANFMIVITKSGNQYGFGNGYALIAKERIGVKVGHDAPPIRFGEQWELPIITESGREIIRKTSRIESVVVQYKIAPEGFGGVQVDAPSPFAGLKSDLEQFRQQHDK